MVSLAARWLCLGLLVGVVGTMSGCTAQSDPPNGGSPAGGQESPGVGGVTADWFESWETAPLGPKENLEIFEADTGTWGVRLLARGSSTLVQNEPLVAANGSWTGGEVSILDGDRLFLRSHAAYLGSYSDAGPVWTAKALVAKLPLVPPVDSSEIPLHTQFPRLLRDSLGIPLTTDTTFSGIFDCQTHVLDASEYMRESYVGIALAVGLSTEGIPGAPYWTGYVEFQLSLLHESSVAYVLDALDDPQFPFPGAVTILIPDQFERNIYDDLVAVHGDDFVEYCHAYPCTILYIELFTYSQVSPFSTSSGDPPDDPGRFVESACYVDELKISTSPSNPKE